jgi:pyruvoyl-dependent arginine decarboxylase
VAATVTPRPAPQASPSEASGLDISIRTGSGSGRTPLSAFDSALQSAGVADFNLVTLSSVIPPGSRLRHVSNTLPGGHGDLLFCVRAEAHAEQIGDTAWAGLGWCVDETGGGLFVEHHGASEASVARQIELSLGDMNAKRGGRYGPVQMALASAESTGEPACAVVVAAYRVSSWHEDTSAGGDRPSAAQQAAAHQGPNGQSSNGLANGLANGASSHWATDGAPATPAPVPVDRSGPTPVVPKHIRVTDEKELDYVAARRFYDLYRQSFGPMATQAVARQLLHESEFIEEMLDPRVHKFVAWSEDDEAIGLTTLTSELESVPWISPDYFAHHYPEHHARGAIWYLGFTLVHPDYQGRHVFHAMLGPMYDLVKDDHPVVAWDMCLVNDELGLGGSAGRLFSTFANVTVSQVDRQNYYVGDFREPLDNPAG